MILGSRIFRAQTLRFSDSPVGRGNWPRDEDTFSGEATAKRVVLLFWDRAAMWSPGWLQTHGPVSASGILGLQMARSTHFEDRCLEVFWSLGDSISSNRVCDIFQTVISYQMRWKEHLGDRGGRSRNLKSSLATSGAQDQPGKAATDQSLSPQNEQNKNKSLPAHLKIHWLLLRVTLVGLIPGTHTVFTSVHISSSRASDGLFWTPLAPSMDTVPMHTCR